MNILIIAEHDGNELKSSTLSAITAASQITENIDLVLFSNGDQELLNNAKKNKYCKESNKF